MSSGLAKRLSLQFTFTVDESKKILSHCRPRELWLEEFPVEADQELDANEFLVMRVIEARAHRFLNYCQSDKRPPSKVEQRRHLELLDAHITGLLRLLLVTNHMDGSTADPFKFLERSYREKGKPYSIGGHRDRIVQDILPIQMFVRWRLKNDLKPRDDEKLEEETKRRKTFPRFCLIADLLAAYQRITGKEPMATVHGERYSEAIMFLLAAANPILKSARQPQIDVENAKKEIIAVKRLWRGGIRPELTYEIPDWGKHNLTFGAENNP
ncbi:hypothetical protein [Sinorhizobium fredii]|uniref:hypothetical protein n=1 Tax=Rhizobium fredii TaxID=380 RepID=UPI0004B63B46|nr:hypothetical protein [Sinorhizobium fredii]